MATACLFSQQLGANRAFCQWCPSSLHDSWRSLSPTPILLCCAPGRRRLPQTNRALLHPKVLKHLRSRMPPELLSTLTALKEGGPGTSDFGLHMSSLECFLASMVAGKDGHTCAVSGSYLCGLKSCLESMFGSFLSKEVILGIVDVFALRCSKTPSIQEENEKLVVDLLNYLVESSCIKMNGSQLLTPPLKRKDVMGNSPKAPAKHLAKKGNPMQEPYIVDAKVLFPEVEGIHVVDGPSKITKEPTKEVSLNDEVIKLCKNSDALYNKINVVRSKVDVEAATTVQNAESPSLSIVSGYRFNVAVCGVYS